MSTKCVICNFPGYEELLSLSCARFNNSFLYNPIRIVCCKRCGHIYNLLTTVDEENLIDYYKYEYSKINMSSPNKTGDIPGSINRNSLRRYSLLYDFIKSYLKSSDSILDIGCATGGFLKFLKQKGITKLYGVDFPDDYVNVALKDTDLIIKQGYAENIPDFNTKFNFIFADQVVEHLLDPNLIFIEAKKTLKRNGYLCISVPDATRYDRYYFFDFYWFLLKEHIHHFDEKHLIELARKHGFYAVACIQTFTNMTSDRTILPILSILFKYSKKTIWNRTNSFNLKDNLKSYITHSYKELAEKQSIFKTVKPTYIYGMCREFLFLYENTSLKSYKLATLIDDTLYHQKNTTFKKKKIKDSSILKNAKGVLLISAVAHTKLLKKKLKDLNFKGKIISF